MKLRWHQAEAIQAVMTHEGDKGALIVAATGTGKTATATDIVAAYRTVGKRVLWVAPRRELVEQARKALTDWWPDLDAGFLMNGLGNDLDGDCIYAGVDTLRARSAKVKGKFDLILCDEAHLFTDARMALVRSLLAEGGRLVGMTATPERQVGSMYEHWEIVHTFSMMDALEHGMLITPYAAVVKPERLDLSRVGETKTDYLPAEVEAELVRSCIVDHVAEVAGGTHEASALPGLDDTRTFTPREMSGGLVFLPTVALAKRVRDRLAEDDWRVRLITGETPKDLRAQYIAGLGDGRLDILVNVMTLTVGTDIPRANWVMLVRPTRQHALFTQILGRVLRLHPGQDAALVLDLVGATEEHSIVSAPVLVHGIDCEESPDGKHRYLPLGTGEGRCQHCQRFIKCFANLGGHVHHNGSCRKCGAVQCPESHDNMHHYVAWQPGLRVCVNCATEVPDPESALVGKSRHQKEPVEWMRLRIPHQEVWCAVLANQGILYNARRGELWSPLWCYQDRVVPLSSGAVPAHLSRTLTDDVARRSSKVRKRYGGFPNKRRRATGFRNAMGQAVKHRVWEH